MSNKKEFDALDIPEEEHKKTVQALRVTELVRHKSSDLYPEKLRSQIKPHQEDYLPPIKSADIFIKPILFTSFSYTVKENENDLQEFHLEVAKEVKNYLIKEGIIDFVHGIQVQVYFCKKYEQSMAFFYFAPDGSFIGYVY